MFNNKDRVTYGNSPGMCVNTRYTPPEVHPHSFKNFFFCNQTWCVLITIGFLFIYRLLAYVPVPGVDTAVIAVSYTHLTLPTMAVV